MVITHILEQLYSQPSPSSLLLHHLSLSWTLPLALPPSAQRVFRPSENTPFRSSCPRPKNFVLHPLLWWHRRLFMFNEFCALPVLRALIQLFLIGVSIKLIIMTIS